MDWDTITNGSMACSENKTNNSKSTVFMYSTAHLTHAQTYMHACGTYKTFKPWHHPSDSTYCGKEVVQVVGHVAVLYSLHVSLCIDGGVVRRGPAGLPSTSGVEPSWCSGHGVEPSWHSRGGVAGSPTRAVYVQGCNPHSAGGSGTSCLQPEREPHKRAALLQFVREDASSGRFRHVSIRSGILPRAGPN